MKKALATAGLFCVALGANQANAECGDIEARSTCSTQVSLDVDAFVVVHGLNSDAPISLAWNGTNSGTTTASVPVCIGTNANSGEVSIQSTSAFQLTGEGSQSGPIAYTLAWGSNSLTGNATNSDISEGVVGLDQCTSASSNPQNLTVTVQNSAIAAADSGINYTQALELVIAPE